MFSIKSTSSNRELIFSNRNGDYFQAKLKGSVIAAVNVFAYTDKNGLNELFQKIGSFEKPWENELSWESLEGEFKLSVSCSLIGEVQIKLNIWIMQGAPEECRIETRLASEFGQLKNIAKESEKFFS